MIGGIFETIGQTLGVGEDKYFLELDDAAENSPPALKKTATKAVEAAKDSSADVAKSVTNVAETATTSAKAVAKETQSTADAGQKQAKKVAKKAEKSAAKANKTAKPVASKKAAPATTAQAEVAAATDATALIVNAIAAAEPSTEASGNTEVSDKVAASITNFSTDFLMPQGNRGRRRPGPSLGGFKSMAKAVNPRLRG